MLHHIEEKELRLPKDRILQLKLNKFFVFTGLLLLILPQGISAVEPFSRDSEHRGIVDLAPYQIYPENRIGNGIYLDNKLLDTHPQRVILNITSIKNTKSYVYLFRAENEVLGLDIVKDEADGDARFWKVDPEFYQYTNRTSGIQRVFRIYQEKIVPLLTNIRTGAVVATSANHTILYHITDSKEITRTNSSGQVISQRVYTFRLHLINRNFKKIQSLSNLLVQDFSYRLKLKWVNEYSVSYKLSNGKEKIIDLRKHAPTYF
jgi:hypothetical protein